MIFQHAGRRRFRFGLRTLLVVVTLAAVGSWGFWFGWPAWQAFQLRKTFESNVRSLKVGDHLTSTSNLAGAKNDGLIVLQQAEAMSWKTGIKYMSSHSDLPGHYPQMEYTNDFFCFLNGDRKNNPGFQYELIYSDPPAKPEGI